jgi:hypothetical protein
LECENARVERGHFSRGQRTTLVSAIDDEAHRRDQARRWASSLPDGAVTGRAEC